MTMPKSRAFCWFSRGPEARSDEHEECCPRTATTLSPIPRRTPGRKPPIRQPHSDAEDGRQPHVDRRAGSKWRIGESMGMPEEIGDQTMATRAKCPRRVNNHEYPNSSDHEIYCPTVHSRHARSAETAREATTVTRIVTTIKPRENAIDGAQITGTRVHR